MKRCQYCHTDMGNHKLTFCSAFCEIAWNRDYGTKEEPIPDEAYVNPLEDHDTVEYSMFLQNHRGCSRWFTWSIVIAATLLAVLYWALIWRS